MVPGHPCTVPNDPINGHKNCTEDERAVHCTLACQHGFAFAFRPAGDYTCLLDQSEVSTGSRDLSPPIPAHLQPEHRMTSSAVMRALGTDT